MQIYRHVFKYQYTYPLQGRMTAALDLLHGVPVSLVAWNVIQGRQLQPKRKTTFISIDSPAQEDRRTFVFCLLGLYGESTSKVTLRPWHVHITNPFDAGDEWTIVKGTCLLFVWLWDRAEYLSNSQDKNIWEYKWASVSPDKFELLKANSCSSSWLVSRFALACNHQV